jgi:hypothetical protein
MTLSPPSQEKPGAARLRAPANVSSQKKTRKPSLYKRVSDDEATQIRHWVRAGWSQADIARQLGRPEKSIRRVLKRHQIIPMPRPGTWSMADLGELDRLHADDFTGNAMAVILQRTRQSISRQRRHYGPVVRRANIVLYLRNSTYRALENVGWELGMARHELARCVLRICEREGLWAYVLNLDNQRQSNADAE